MKVIHIDALKEVSKQNLPAQRRMLEPSMIICRARPTQGPFS
jgi:hypothetical protein